MSVPAFVQQHLARPSLLIGTAVALTAGLSLGSYLRAGELLPERPAPQVVVALATVGPEPIRYMTNADGRVPDYVIGTDHTYRPAELPLIRTAWEEPRPVDDTADLPTFAVNDTLPPAPASYAAPPSLGGDILAVSTAGEPAPVG